jgi:hypothetical protein
MIARCLWLLLLAPFITYSQDPLLARIKSRVVENLKRAPMLWRNRLLPLTRRI